MISEALAVTVCHRLKVESPNYFRSFRSRGSASLRSQPAFSCVVRGSEQNPLKGKQEARWMTVNTRQGHDKACSPSATRNRDQNLALLSQGVLDSGPQSGRVSVCHPGSSLCSLPLTSGVSSCSLPPGGHGSETRWFHTGPLHRRPRAASPWRRRAFLPFPRIP